MGNILLQFQASDFIGNDYSSNTDCAIARAIKRQIGEGYNVGGATININTRHVYYINDRSFIVNGQLQHDFVDSTFAETQQLATEGKFESATIELIPYV